MDEHGDVRFHRVSQHVGDLQSTPVGIPNAQHSAVVGNTHIDRAADAVCEGDYFFLNVILRNGFQLDSFRLPEISSCPPFDSALPTS